MEEKTEDIIKSKIEPTISRTVLDPSNIIKDYEDDIQEQLDSLINEKNFLDSLSICLGYRDIEKIKLAIMLFNKKKEYIEEHNGTVKECDLDDELKN